MDCLTRSMWRDLQILSETGKNHEQPDDLDDVADTVWFTFPVFDLVKNKILLVFYSHRLLERMVDPLTKTNQDYANCYLL